MVSSYKPFPIAEFKTGLFNYLEPWIRPTDAFEPLDNAYVFRGSIYKRQGTVFFGNMHYCDNAIIYTAAIAANGTATGTLAKFPIDTTIGGFVVTVLTAGGKETFTNTTGISPEVITGSLGSDTFTINYTTGAWTLQLAGGNSKAANIPVVAHYSYFPLDMTTPQEAPIMGIKQFIDETTNTKKIVIMDTKRLSYYNPITKVFNPVCNVSETLYIAQGGSESPSLNVGFTNVAPYSISITDGTSTIVDTPSSSTAGTFNSSGNFAAGSTINYATGAITLNLGAGSVAGTKISITLNLQGDYFTGTSANFFNATNWLSDLYLTNDVDRITLFDGANVARPPFPVTAAHNTSFTNDITTALDVKVYKNRLLLLAPVVSGDGSFPQSIRWSQQFVPTNFAADVAGQGGELAAPTADFIQASQFLRDILVVFFENSTWVFRFTGNANDPFRFDKINSSKSTNAPYGSLSYDERVTSMGNLGLIATDGVNVQRYDENVIDLFNDIDQDLFNMCFSQRFDQLNQSWMLYVSQAGAATNNGVSDKAIIYNFIESTWATYSISLSCLGIGFQTTDVTWGDFAAGLNNGIQYKRWARNQVPWNSYLEQATAPVLLGGDHVGNVFILNEGTVDFLNEDSETSPTEENITATITTTKWNPFIGIGSKTQFGYVDIYYQVDNQCVFQVEFFADNSTAPASTQTLTLDTPKSVNNDYEWKRIYINLTGEFVRMNLTTSSQATFKIVGMMLWARDAGRLVP